MTDTETIAVKLFGWEPCGPPYPKLESRPYRWYIKPAMPLELSCYIGFEVDHVAFSRFSESDWPNFSHPREQHYWIRRMEDALAEKRLLPRYIMELLSQPYTEAQDLERRRLGFVNEVFWFFTRSTPAQRVAACLKVIDETDL